MRQYPTSIFKDELEFSPRAGETDQARVREVLDTLMASFDQAPCDPYASDRFYAVELWVFSRDGAAGMAERDEREAAVVRALRRAGYVTHDGPCCKRFSPYTVADPNPNSVLALPAAEEHGRPVLLAYRTEWGGTLPRHTLWTTYAATYLGYSGPGQLLAAVDSGEIPDLSNERGDWPVLGLDRLRAGLSPAP